jgi:hypothetical protein
MQCYGACFGIARESDLQLGGHLDKPAVLKDASSLKQHQQRSCSPVSNCSNESHFTRSSGSSYGLDADVLSCKDRDQPGQGFGAQHNNKPPKVSSSMIMII